MKKRAKKLNILVATGLYGAEIGGPATYTRILEAELPKHDISVIVAPFNAVRLLPKGVRHLVYFFYLLIKSIRVQVIYALDPVSVGFPAAMVARLMHKRFLVRIAGDYAWEQGVSRFGIKESLDSFSLSKAGYPFMVRTLKKVQLFVTSDAERVVVPSRYLKKIVSNWGVEKEHIEVIYNSFDAPAGLAKREVLRQMMHLEDPVIISAGRLVPWKGYEALIELIPEIQESKPGTKLFIAGSGAEEQKLERLIAKNELEDSVVLVGQLDSATLHSYIKAADVFVLNTFYEGLSHILLECMAIGTPIVTTPAGGNPEIIEHKRTGLVAPYNDKKELLRQILIVLKDKDEAESIVEGAKKKVSKFTKVKMIKELIEVLHI